MRNHTEKTHAKEMITPKSCEKYICPVSDGTVTLSGGDQELKKSTLTRDHPIRGERHQDFPGESEGPPPPPHFQDSFLDAGEKPNDFWFISEDFTCDHHVDSRVKLCASRAESFTYSTEMYWRLQEYSYKIQEKTHRWFVGFSWTVFTHFTLLKEKPPDRYMWCGGRRTKRQVTPRSDHLLVEIWRSMSKNSKTKEKQNWTSEKPKLDNATRLRRSYFIDPEIPNSRNSLCMHGKSWKSQQSLLCLVKGQIADMWSPVARMMIPNQKLRASMEVEEFKRLRMEGTLPKIQEDHIAGKRSNSLQHFNLVHAVKESVD